MRGFVNFIREQGIIGLAVGFLLGGSASRVVSSLVNDLINPLIGLALNALEILKK
jgi:large conductance mechanosensitive channel